MWLIQNHSIQKPISNSPVSSVCSLTSQPGSFSRSMNAQAGHFSGNALQTKKEVSGFPLWSILCVWLLGPGLFCFSDFCFLCTQWPHLLKGLRILGCGFITTSLYAPPPPSWSTFTPDHYRQFLRSIWILLPDVVLPLRFSASQFSCTEVLGC